VFDNTPAAKDGTLQSGDELVGVNGVSVKGKTKVEVAKMIQASKVRNTEYVLGVSEMITLNFTATFFVFFSSFTFMLLKTTHLHLVPRLRLSIAILLFFCMCVWHHRDSFMFYLSIKGTEYSIELS
jgi:hypothetical protein